MTTEERVKEIISEQLGVALDSVVDDANIYDDLGADSLDAIELIMALEEEFDIEIPEEQAEDYVVVCNIVAKVKDMVN